MKKAYSSDRATELMLSEHDEHVLQTCKSEHISYSSSSGMNNGVNTIGNPPIRGILKNKYEVPPEREIPPSALERAVESVTGLLGCGFLTKFPDGHCHDFEEQFEDGESCYDDRSEGDRTIPNSGTF